MTALPRLHAITDARILALPDLPARAARLAAAAGPALAVHVRDRALPARALMARATAIADAIRPAGARLVVHGRADVAATLGAWGLQLGQGDLTPLEARQAAGPAWSGRVGVSVHDRTEARLARQHGADWVLLGNLRPTTTHPGRPGIGYALLEELARGSGPVLAIGGLGPDDAPAVQAAGAYGIAAITALWDAADLAAAARAMLAPWGLPA